MKSFIVAACLILGASSFALVSPAQAEVDVNLPGVHIDANHGRHDEGRRHEVERRRDHCDHCR
jgi:hypothetical protein